MKAEIVVSPEEVLALVKAKIAEKNPDLKLGKAVEIVGSYDYGDTVVFEGVKIVLDLD